MKEEWFTEDHTGDVRLSIKARHSYGEDTPFQRIDFYESDTFGRFFTLDGLMMVAESDERHYHEMLVHVPMAVAKDPKKVLVIGGGDGGTVRELARYPGIERIDMVEIDERVVRLCQKFLPSVAGAIDADPRIHPIFEDGVRFLKETADAAYDLILVDSTDPIGPGEGLFSRKFYQDCHRTLTADGILVNQHESPFYATYAQSMRRAHKRLRETFAVSEVYHFHMPTYPSGMWLFGFASKGIRPVEDRRPEADSPAGTPAMPTRYYSRAMHAGAFALPPYVAALLSEEGGA